MFIEPHNGSEVLEVSRVFIARALNLVVREMGLDRVALSAGAARKGEFHDYKTDDYGH